MTLNSSQVEFIILSFNGADARAVDRLLCDTQFFFRTLGISLKAQSAIAVSSAKATEYTLQPMLENEQPEFVKELHFHPAVLARFRVLFFSALAINFAI